MIDRRIIFYTNFCPNAWTKGVDPIKPDPTPIPARIRFPANYERNSCDGDRSVVQYIGRDDSETLRQLPKTAGVEADRLARKPARIELAL